MAYSPARRPLLLLLLMALLLLAALSSCPVVCAAVERRRSEAPAMAPDVAAARQEFHVAPAADGMPMNGGGTGRRPAKGWRRSGRRGRGGGTGAWTFSAMLPRGFVPPSGSSTCHNDMPSTAAEAEFFACGAAGSP